MKKILMQVVYAAASFVAAQVWPQQCPNCRPAPAAQVAAKPAAAPAVEWRSVEDAPGQALLFIDGVQRGGYRQAYDEFRGYDPAARSWGPPQHLFPKLIPVSRGAVPLPE